MMPEMIATAVEVASAESLTLARIAQRVEEEHGPLPCTLETLGNTLKKQGRSYLDLNDGLDSFSAFTLICFFLF
jgi:hypothetical protein